MKLIVAGATDLLGMEIVRQSLQLREITEVIALTRRPLQLEKGIGSSKLRIVLIRDYGNYPDSVKAEFARADACIWYVTSSTPIFLHDLLLTRLGTHRNVAISPFRVDNFDFAEVKRVCQDCTKLGFEAMYEAGPARPFRFMYLSTQGTPRDPTERPIIMAEYHLMRVRNEKPTKCSGSNANVMLLMN